VDLSILRLPQEAAVNAVYAKKIAELPEEYRADFIEQRREEYRQEASFLLSPKLLVK